MSMRMSSRVGPYDAELLVRILNAQDLKDVKHVGSMNTYVMVEIRRPDEPPVSEEAVKVRTLSRGGGTNPTWNETLVLPCRSDVLWVSKGGLSAWLQIHIFCSNSLLGDKLVGSVLTRFSDFSSHLDPATGRPACLSTWQNTMAQVSRPSGRFQGVLNFAVKLDVQTPEIMHAKKVAQAKEDVAFFNRPLDKSEYVDRPDSDFWGGIQTSTIRRPLPNAQDQADFWTGIPGVTKRDSKNYEGGAIASNTDTSTPSSLGPTGGKPPFADANTGFGHFHHVKPPLGKPFFAPFTQVGDDKVVGGNDVYPIFAFTHTPKMYAGIDAVYGSNVDGIPTPMAMEGPSGVGSGEGPGGGN